MMDICKQKDVLEAINRILEDGDIALEATWLKQLPL